MKLRCIGTGLAPTYYAFDGEIITAFHGGQSESFDLSRMEAGGKLAGVEPESLALSGSQIIRDAYRDDNGELHVTLCQQVGPGHWSESDWIDATDYDPDAVYAVLDTNRPYSGRAWAMTRQGKQFVGVDNG